MSNTGTEVTAETVVPQSVMITRVLTHLRKPENLVTYLMFTAWMKFMGISEHVPTITLG